MRSLIRSGCLPVAGSVVAAGPAGCGDTDEGGDEGSGPAPAKSDGIAEMEPAKALRTIPSSLAVGVCLLGLLTGCVDDDSTGERAPGPQPNGVAGMKPERAMTVARRTMSRLHDAIYETTTVVELEGRTERAKVVETVTKDGCQRVVSHPELGRLWIRVLGGTMYFRANDKAGEAIGRTPAQIEVFRGRWLKGPAPALLRGCDLDQLLPDRRSSGLVEATGRTKVDGRPGRRFEVEGSGITVICVIATRGPALMISGRTIAEAGAFPELAAGLSVDGTSVLVDTDTGAEVKVPPDRLVIDPAELQSVPA